MLRTRRTRIAAVGLSLVLTVIALVLTRQEEGVVIVRSHDDVRQAPLSEVLQTDFGFTDGDTPALTLPELAALAANVYEGDEFAPACVPGEPGRIALEGWGQLGDFFEPTACHQQSSGMEYEVWGKLVGEIGHIAIVFRGTAEPVHWCSNLRDLETLLCRPETDQYLHVVSLLDDLLDRIYDEFGQDRYVVLVGHSLGGGLAELGGRATYLDQVFSFDPSPVTGDEISSELVRAWQDPDSLQLLAERHAAETGCELGINNPAWEDNVTIHRVFEHGEVLAYPRLLKRWLSPRDSVPRVIEYRTNVLRGGVIDQHGIKALACALRDPPQSSESAP